MKKIELQVSFVTPAFLGNAEQQGQWRTPPFKALLRQWWRVAVAKDCKYDVDALRQREFQLFGCVVNDNSWGKSKVRLRLDKWAMGSLSTWPGKGFHALDGGIRSDVYLGFGPVNFQKSLEHPPAIDVGKSMRLIVGLIDANDQQRKEIKQAIQLAAWFGTMGSRSRNSWGSLLIQGDGISPMPMNVDALADVTRSLQDCLNDDWASAIGMDMGKPLVWSKKVTGWEEAVNKLGQLRKSLRQAVQPHQGPNIKASVLLGYPLTKYKTNSLDKNARVPNQIRFKVLRNGESLYLFVAHFPCCISQSLWESDAWESRTWVEKNQLRIWGQVHKILDSKLSRIGGLV